MGTPGGQRILVGLAWIGGLVGLFLALKYAVPYFLPFLVAVLLAVLMDPTVNGIEERLRVPRGWAVALALFFFFSLFAALLLFLTGAIVVQLGELAANLPAHYEKLVLFSEDMLDRLTEAYSGMPEDMVALIDTSVRGSLQSVYLGLSRMVTAALAALRGLPMAFVVFLVAMVATFFVSRDKKLIAAFCLSLVPAAWRDRVRVVNRDVLSSIVGLVKAQLLLVGLTAVLTVIGLLLLGVKYAWLIGLLTGVLDVLPVVGPAVILVPWAAYSLIEGNTALGIGLLILHVGLSVFRQIMEPRLIGQKLGLHPLVALLSLYLGIQLLGLTGLVVGPLVAIIIKAIWKTGPNPPATSSPGPASRGAVRHRGDGRGEVGPR